MFVIFHLIGRLIFDTFGAYTVVIFTICLVVLMAAATGLAQIAPSIPTDLLGLLAIPGTIAITVLIRKPHKEN